MQNQPNVNSDSVFRSLFGIRWQPGQDTAVALATAAAMIPIYYVGTHVKNADVSTLVFVILGNGILNVLLPAYYMLWVRRENAAELGITTRRWLPSLLIAGVWSFFAWHGLQRELHAHPSVNFWPQLIYNGLIFWEPFFVFGWLQLRFDRAFGLVPGVVLAGICFAAYHLGTYPPSGVAVLAVVGVFHAVLFRMTKNLLTVWPLPWAIVSSIGTLQGNMHFGWNAVALYAVVLLVQAIAIAALILLRRHPRNG
jgi:hypothetical protein